MRKSWYPFAGSLYPKAPEVLARLRSWGQTVILWDGDVVFQPRKAEHSGISAVVDGPVLIYHKEDVLQDVDRRYPADHYAFVDDKLRILSAAKKAGGDRVTTVFPHQGNFAHDTKVLATYPAADVIIEKIADLLEFELSHFQKVSRAAAGSASHSKLNEVKR